MLESRVAVRAQWTDYSTDKPGNWPDILMKLQVKHVAGS